MQINSSVIKRVKSAIIWKVWWLCDFQEANWWFYEKSFQICWFMFFKIQKLSWMWIIVIITWCNMCPAHFRRLQTLQKELYLAVSWSKVDPPNPLLHYRLLKLFKYSILHNARVMHNVVFFGGGCYMSLFRCHWIRVIFKVFLRCLSD